MSKPHIHAESSVKKFGGKPEDYMPIHNLLDSSKAAICDSRHRALTHNAWFIGVILEKIFGDTITNSDGKKVSVRDIGEQHVHEDFSGKFVPSAQDWLINLEFKPWMDNGKEIPNSLAEKVVQVHVPLPPPDPSLNVHPSPSPDTGPWNPLSPKIYD